MGMGLLREGFEVVRARVYALDVFGVIDVYPDIWLKAIFEPTYLSR